MEERKELVRKEMKHVVEMVLMLGQRKVVQLWTHLKR